MANTKKSKKVLKVVTGVTSLALVGAISFGLTYAYLKDTTNQKTNTFTAGDVSITVDEPSFPGTDQGDGTYKISYTPGQTIDKDPSVNLGDGTNDAYVAMKVTFKVATTQDASGNWSYKNISYTGFQNYATLKSGATNGFNTTNWSMVDSGTTDGVVLYYKGTESSTNFAKVEAATGTTPETEAIFDKVEFKSQADLDDLMVTDKDGNKVYPDIKIEVTGYAVQADNVDDKALNSTTDGSAKKLLDALING